MGSFDNIDHEVLLSILREKLHDNRFLRLVEHLLKAGYMKDWKRHPTLSGTPQGGICSPILSNIYLARLDTFVEQTLLPEFTRGTKRRVNPVYDRKRCEARRRSQSGRATEAIAIRKQLREIPSHDPDDPGYRRLRYIRYADDTLLGFVGPKDEAEAIKGRLRQFLKDTLHLELSEDKTLITHATTQAARFLGYEIVSQQCNTKTHLVQRGDQPYRKRAINGAIGLRVPADVVEGRCALYKRRGKPIHRPELQEDHDLSIVATYQAEYRGYVEYYALAQNITWLKRLRWIMETSLLKTLAAKHQASVRKMARQYRTTVLTEHGPRACLEVRMERGQKRPLIARFGGIPLRRRNTAILEDRPLTRRRPEGVELIQRLLADECELCKSTEQVQVHHIRKLADLKGQEEGKTSAWRQKMAARRRKTLVLCRECHVAVHAGRATRQPRTV